MANVISPSIVGASGDPAASTGASTGAASSAAPNTTKLKALAQQFEAMLITQMMHDMQKSMLDEGSDDEKEGAADAGPLGESMFAELGLALSRAGGLGLTDALSGALARQADAVTQESGLAIGTMPLTMGTVPLTMGSPATAAFLSAPTSSAFGARTDPIDGTAKFHQGTDIPMAVGSEVQTVADGRVTEVGERGGYGLMVEVAHAGGVVTRYAHLSSAAVKVGDTVTRGQVIAASGNSGRSTGPHLHFEVLQDGQPIDPMGSVASQIYK